MLSQENISTFYEKNEETFQYLSNLMEKNENMDSWIQEDFIPQLQNVQSQLSDSSKF